MDDRGFRKSKNIEIRKRTIAADPTVPVGSFDAEPWASQAIAATNDDNQLAQDLGIRDVGPAARRVKELVAKGDPTPASFEDRFDAVNNQPLPADPTGAGTAAHLLSAPSGGSAREAIIRAARAAGENPAYALAVAERESAFNPAARSSKTIRGLYQMRGDLRAKYGVGDSQDPGDQAAGWMRSLPDIRRDMNSVLGRDPTDQEAYLGHHFGARRAARTLQMDPSTPVDSIFTPQEMVANPHFARAGTIGNLNGTVMGDIGKRMARFGGGGSEPATEPADLSSYGTPVASSEDAPSKPQEDLSSFGSPVEQQPQLSSPAAPSAPQDLSKFGTAA